MPQWAVTISCNSEFPVKTAASSCGYSIPDESSEFPSCGEPRILALKQRPTGAKVGVSARAVGEICRFSEFET
jgi:hypothetical protein